MTAILSASCFCVNPLLRRTAANLCPKSGASFSARLALVDPSGAIPNYAYYVYFRTFAPFDYFGGFGTNAFVGDGNGRAFSTALTGPNAGYRMSGVSTAERSGGEFPVLFTRAEAAAISTNVYTGVKAQSECTISGEFYGYNAYNSGNGAATSFTMSGNDDAVFYDIPLLNSVAWDIDMNVNWRTTFSGASQTYGVGAEIMNITGGVNGDAFPAAESFIYDDHGNGIMLGVSPVPPDRLGPEPETRLAGQNTRPMINFNVNILIRNGAFQGVLENGNLISTEDWNRRFTSQPTRSQ